MNVVLVGAGVAGLSIAWRLLQAGCTVTVLDRAQPAQAATWASAGMIALTAELEDASDAEIALARAADLLWPDFAAELEAASGMTVGYDRSGSLMLAGDAAALAVMQARAAADPALAMLGATAARAQVPLLAPDVLGGLWSAREARVDNRRLGEALTVAVLKAGGHILANEAVVAIEGRRVRTPYGLYEGDVLVVAAGAWSGQLLGIPVTPVKGEIIALQSPDGVVPAPVVWGNGVYVVPRGDRLLVGATVQAIGFDTALTSAARDHLRSRAEGLMPALREWRLADHWAGLRPGSPDGLPLLGPLGRPDVLVASGQYRNGILFAPAIARHVSAMAQGLEQPVPAFDPNRFVLPGASHDRLHG